MLDRLQREAQAQELEPANTSPTAFRNLTMVQVIVVRIITRFFLSWRFECMLQEVQFYHIINNTIYFVIEYMVV